MKKQLNMGLLVYRYFQYMCSHQSFDGSSYYVDVDVDVDVDLHRDLPDVFIVLYTS